MSRRLLSHAHVAAARAARRSAAAALHVPSAPRSAGASAHTRLPRYARLFSTTSSDSASASSAEPSTSSSPSPSSSSPTSAPSPPPLHNTRKLSFQTETRQILDIVTHSLYTDKEIFLRELISNASDALEKARYLQSTNSNAELADPALPFEIQLSLDAANNTLTVRDTGVGMSEEELISNLGTIARSGSKAFVQQLKDAGKLLVLLLMVQRPRLPLLVLLLMVQPQLSSAIS